MDNETATAIVQICRDLAELCVNPSVAKKEVYIGMTLALGRFYEAYHPGESMTRAGGQKIDQWAKSVYARKVILS